ncbi:MAG: glycosyltransferase family 4 protein [Planctomycetota bacterium]
MREQQAYRMVQLGMGWLPDQAGGLNRYYHDLLRSFAEQRDDERANASPPAWDISGFVAGPGFACVKSTDPGTDGTRSTIDVTNGTQVLDSDAERLGIRSFTRRDASLAHRLWASRKMLRRIKVDPVDLIVCHFALYLAPGLGQLGQSPLVVHFHGPWANESAQEGDQGFSNRLKHWIESRVYRRADRIITLSEAFADVVVKNFGVSRSKVSVIPGGVDLDRFCPSPTDGQISDPDDSGASDRVSNTNRKHVARERLGWDPDRPTIVCIRRLVPRMGIDRLIRAVGPLVRRHPRLQVMIGGTGKMKSDLESLIDECDLRSHVRLLGFIEDDDLPWAYRAADFSVVPTIALEGFGLIVAESLAAGTPCLVTPVGGLPEVVAGLSPELVFDSPDVSSLSGRIDDVLSGRIPLPGPNECRRHAESHFNWRQIADQVAEVYRQAIDHARHSNSKLIV